MVSGTLGKRLGVVSNLVESLMYILPGILRIYIETQIVELLLPFAFEEAPHLLNWIQF